MYKKWLTQHHFIFHWPIRNSVGQWKRKWCCRYKLINTCVHFQQHLLRIPCPSTHPLIFHRPIQSSQPVTRHRDPICSAAKPDQTDTADGLWQYGSMMAHYEGNFTWILSHEYPGTSNHWHLNCFIQQHVQYKNKENANALHHWPFVRGIQQWLVDSPHKGPVMKKAFPCHGIIMTHRNHQRHKRLDHISSGDEILISSMWCLDMCILYENIKVINVSASAAAKALTDKMYVEMKFNCCACLNDAIGNVGNSPTMFKS